jgi:hypothetical protein
MNPMNLIQRPDLKYPQFVFHHTPLTKETNYEIIISHSFLLHGPILLQQLISCHSSDKIQQKHSRFFFPVNFARQFTKVERDIACHASTDFKVGLSQQTNLTKDSVNGSNYSSINQSTKCDIKAISL